MRGATRYLDLCAVILAGGRSLRMGRNKALIEFEGETLISRSARVCGGLTDEVLVSADDPAPYRFLNLPVVPDRFTGMGPMAGLHAAMLHSHRGRFLVLACDLPRVTERLVRRIVEQSAGFDIVVPRTSDSQIHPLCAVYRHSLLPGIESRLREGRNRMRDLSGDPEYSVREVCLEELGFNSLDLVNWNTPEDLQTYYP